MTTHHFSYLNGVFYAEKVPLNEIAEQFGTPVYVYSKAAISESYNAYAQSAKQFGKGENPALICFSVKSNSNIGVLDCLSKLGAGFDIVSGGELMRVIAAGGNPRKVIFSGVGKTEKEIRLALQHEIHCFNIESLSELTRINKIAKEMGKTAPVSFRINPNIDAKTHPYISTGLKENKFGIDYSIAVEAYLSASKMPNVKIIGLDCHIGSQLLDDSPLIAALDKMTELYDTLYEKGIKLKHIDIGGGLGITYNEEKAVKIQNYMKRLISRLNKWREEKYKGEPLQIILEPGRSIVGNAGVLLTEVQYIKTSPIKNFAIVDGAMNDLMRPAMYEAWHTVHPVKQKAIPAKNYDVVGPICESSDWLAKERNLAIEEGDILAVMSAGAYGMSMSSNYNTRTRAVEIMVDDDKIHVIRKREEITDLFALESKLPE